jgi:hypothetical protein
MDKTFWLGFLAYLVPTFPLGYFWHLKTFAHRYEALQMYREQVIIPFGLASMIVQGALFSWAYPHLFSTAHEQWASSALACALTYGALSWSFTTLPVAAKFRMTSVSGFVALESAFTALQFAIVGPLLALAYRS